MFLTKQTFKVNASKMSAFLQKAKIAIPSITLYESIAHFFGFKSYPLFLENISKGMPLTIGMMPGAYYLFEIKCNIHLDKLTRLVDEVKDKSHITLETLVLPLSDNHYQIKVSYPTSISKSDKDKQIAVFIDQFSLALISFHPVLLKYSKVSVATEEINIEELKKRLPQ